MVLGMFALNFFGGRVVGSTCWFCCSDDRENPRTWAIRCAEKFRPDIDAEVD